MSLLNTSCMCLQGEKTTWLQNVRTTTSLKSDIREWLARDIEQFPDWVKFMNLRIRNIAYKVEIPYTKLMHIYIIYMIFLFQLIWIPFPISPSISNSNFPCRSENLNQVISHVNRVRNDIQARVQTGHVYTVPCLQHVFAFYDFRWATVNAL